MARHRKLTQKFAGFPLFKLGVNRFTYPFTHSFTKEFVGLDGLSLDLQFATDKTLTARKGPTPVFTRASSGRFVGSDGLIQSAANNEPRFDHDPITLACKGLLIEESRTNSITGSNAFNTWTLAGSTVAASSVVTPEGTADAWKVVEDTLLAAHSATRSFPAVSGTTYTASVWIKSAENSFALVGLTSSGGAFAAASFISVDLSTGAVTTATGSPVSAASVAYSNGWFRVSFSLAAIATFNALIDIRLSRDGIWANRSYLGNGVNGMYCYGAQVEAGSFPTSYIPTTTASLARSADFCSITGGDFTALYNAPEGTLLVNAEEFRRGTSYTPIFRVANSANLVNNRYQIGTNGNKTSAVSPIEFITIADGSLAYGATLNSATSNFKAALAYSVDNMRGSLNGTLATADTAPSALIIGANTFTINSVGGYISAIRYYKKRLPNAKLVTLTA